MDVSEMTGQERRGFLGDFLSRFADAAQGRNETTISTGSDGGSSLVIDANRETSRLLVKTAGDVFFHCSAQLAQVRLKL